DYPEPDMLTTKALKVPEIPEPEPNFKIVNCKTSEGYCQGYCSYMEVQVGYCCKKKDTCCLHQN
ncbi:hypothetical protein HPG69_009513, partial [Diceros bicornis minor]